MAIKAGKLLLILLAGFAVTGILSQAKAQVPYASSCSSVLVSTPFCDELLKQSCIQNAQVQEAPQIQSSVIISSPQNEFPKESAQTVPVIIQSSSEGTELNADRIFDLINQYRASLGLSAFEKNDEVCSLTQIRSTELAAELASGTVHSGLYGRNLPYWIWENAKVGSNEDEAASWWLSSSLHRKSIVGDYKFSCVKCTGNNCSQLFTSFSPKSGE